MTRNYFNHGRYPVASGTVEFTANNSNNVPCKVSVSYYRASYAGGSETTVWVENAIYAIVIRQDYRNEYALTFETGGTIHAGFRTRNAAIEYAISFLLSTTCK